MGYYPIFVDIKGRRVVVVGGGVVAERKILPLVEAGALITVVSPRLGAGLNALVSEGAITHVPRRYKAGDLKGAFIAVSASNSEIVNEEVAAEAEREGVLVNVVTDPALCGFLVPAVVERGPLKIAVSTSGQSPFVAASLKDDLEKRYGLEYGAFAELLGTVRKRLLNEKRKNVKNDRIFRALAASPIPEWIRIGAVERIDDFLEGLLGSSYTTGKLGIKIGCKK